MNPALAEVLAIKALGWLAAQDDLITTFMGASGAQADDLLANAGDPAFLGAVLDFLTMDDSWVTAFCDTEGYSYDMPLAARQVLPGGEQVHWT